MTLLFANYGSTTGLHRLELLHSEAYGQRQQRRERTWQRAMQTSQSCRSICQNHAIFSTLSVPFWSPSTSTNPEVSILFFHFVLSYLARIIVIRSTMPELDSCSSVVFIGVHVHLPNAQFKMY